MVILFKDINNKIKLISSILKTEVDYDSKTLFITETSGDDKFIVDKLKYKDQLNLKRDIISLTDKLREYYSVVNCINNKSPVGFEVDAEGSEYEEDQFG